MITYSDFAGWLNNNQGVLTLTIFLATIFLGWVSGIFTALRRKPKFSVRVIDGPTCACTFLTGRSKGQFEIHRTCIALYLSVSNVGSSPSSIESVSVGYHWNIKPLSLLWLKNSVGWFWLNGQAVALENFQSKIGDSIKIYPFLFQCPGLGLNKTETYLDIGQSTNGVIYFEQPDSWGGCFPKAKNGQVMVKVKLSDTFGKTHTKKFKVPMVSLECARKYNPSFGKTLSALDSAELSLDRF
ncbi:hypothetical protein LCL99_02180 [Halomonas denitrificans]|uniref:hypothetical protein n=1 Tax=Halomonas TaxID=2745 RepID=UPI001A8F88C6|nr:MULTISPECIES: hypothetical protein [Halomonas]MBN8413423.1 hypothetical protein [Halomonas litopenaei]MCA0973273.1 hypothetical protein [Halomonas denitrificans]